MNTLTTLNNLMWDIGFYGGKAAFLFPSLKLSITFHPSVGEYTLWCRGGKLFSDKSPSACLEVADEVILNYHATDFIPSCDNFDTCLGKKQ